jgi:hypothetical protein
MPDNTKVSEGVGGAPAMEAEFTASDLNAYLRDNKTGLNAPRIVCVDGFSMSVQASSCHYCSPRENDGPYSSVEVGFPSARVETFMPYIDGDEDTDPTETVYGYVPVEIVAAVVAEHGGFKTAGVA